ncbi:restriction endonuclease subunit S [Phocaeicola dorei]|uniref:Type I restriction modification DNA specificity domain-containing protein n=3 Tax=Phocaeicola dorei TaxID=357276 RepID=B6VVY9_9BACT|nr:restriction endonuclease subunit S [Phocaeicola dorei]EEB25951.1 type I restriction modification DNA specificity domain protein [Phocaeicola dorei DSM 17855]UWN82092.1 restriction endonuclease subunit S [Phocaeicola dorei]
MRFPEFTGEWEKYPLTDFMSFKNGMNPDAKRFGSGTKFISVMDILNNQYICYDNIRASVELQEGDLDTYGVNYGDIVFQRSSETLEDVGQANVYLDCKPAIFGGFVIRGKSKGNYNPLFLRYLLASPTARKRIIVKGAGAQHFNISQDGLSKVVIDVPNIDEQEKVGKLLQCIDERIATQNKIIDKLQSLISGIIQNAIQKGLNDNTWKMIYLSKLLTERKEKNSNGYEVNSVSVSEGVINQIEYLGRSFAASDTSKYNVVRYGDIVYTKSPTGNFPYGIIKQSFQKHPVAVSPLYGVYEPYSNEAGCFLHYYFLSSIVTTNYLSPLIQKGAKNTINISNQTFLNNMVPYPKEEVGIRPIAALLRNVQIKLNIERLSLVLLEQQKTYLLRSMFI